MPSRSESIKSEMRKESAAWQRKEGKNPKGGLNAKGRASYKAETGGTLKAPVKAGDNPRRASFLARMGNAKGPERNPDGSPTRLLLSLQAWGASSKEDAKAKAKAISARNKPDVEKASFGSRSEAGRYAANVRWKGHEKVESPSTPQGNISRAVGQIVGRLGLPKGDKYGSTHGWSVRTYDNRTVVNWTNRYGDNPEQSVKRIADALTSKGYETSVSGMKIEVTQSPKARTKPDNYAQVVQEIIDEERQMRDPTPTVKPQAEQVESPSQRVLDTVSAKMKLKGRPFPKRERGKNNYYLLLRNHGATHQDAIKEANADDLERKANPQGHAIKDRARRELLREILDAKGTPLTVSSHWDMPYN